MATNLASGCHATPRTWPTGVEPHQLITSSAHAAWQTHAQIQVTDATVTQMTMYGERTAAFSLKNLTYRCWCWGLETAEARMREVTTHLENSSVMMMLKWYLTLQCLGATSVVDEVWRHWRCQWERFLHTLNLFLKVFCFPFSYHPVTAECIGSLDLFIFNVSEVTVRLPFSLVSHWSETFVVKRN